MSKIFNINKSTFTQLLDIAYPMVVSQGAFALMIFTDRFFMSMISPVHMAASMGGGVTVFFCTSLFIGILTYANALVAQYYGANEREKCPRVLTQGLLLCIGFIPLLLVAAYFAGDLFIFMGHEAIQADLEKRYFYILIMGSCLGLTKACLASYFSGIGRTRVVMIADTLGVAVNIPLSYCLIFGLWGLPELGIEGAAYGTVVSMTFSLGLYILFYLESAHKKRFNIDASWVIDKGILRRYLRLGFPSGMELFLNIAAFNLFLLMFQSYGVIESASAAIVFNWDIVSFIPMLGLNVGIISLIGRYIGENNLDQVQGVMHAGFIAGWCYSLAIALAFVIFRTSLVTMFISEGEYYEGIKGLSSFMMVGLASYVMADATLLIAGGVLRGAGDTRWLLWASVSIHWLMLAIQYMVIKVYDLGPKVAWMVFVVMVIITAIIYIHRLRGPKWRTPEALNRVMAEH